MKASQLKAVPAKVGGGVPAAKPPPDKPRSARKLMAPGIHWKKRPRQLGSVVSGFRWESDRLTATQVHLELAQAHDGTLYLTDPNESPAGCLLVCRVTMAEAWNYIAARYLPPALRRMLARCIEEALAEADYGQAGSLADPSAKQASGCRPGCAQGGAK